LKKSSSIRLLGYIIVIGFGLLGVLLKDTVGDYGMILIFAGLPIGVFCIFYALKVERREDKQK